MTFTISNMDSQGIDVSVVISAHNAERWIARTVNSVLDQTYSALELLLVDDGSVDQTIDIVSEIKDPRIHILKYPHAGVNGPAAARNLGLAAAKGRYICFLDHDDLWLPRKLEMQYHALDRDPSVGWVYSWVDVIDEHDRVIRSTPRVSVYGSAYVDLLRGCFVWTGSNPMIRRSVIDSVGYFDESIGPSDDWDMWLRISEQFSITVVPEPLVLWRQSGRSTSQDYAAMLTSAERVLDHAFKRNPNLPLEMQSEARSVLYRDSISWATQGDPNRHASVIAFGALRQAICERPAVVVDLVTQPWLIRGLVKIIAGLVIPEVILKRLTRVVRKIRSTVTPKIA